MRIGKASDILIVTLRWDRDDVQTVGKLAIIDHVAHLEYDESFLDKSGELLFNLSPVRYSAHVGSRRVIRPFDPKVFNGLHGFLHDSLPDGWGRLLMDRRARELGMNPHTLTMLERLAWVGDRGIGALCYAPDANAWKVDGSRIDIDRVAVEMREVMKGHASDVIAELGHIGGSPGGARPKALIAIDSRDGSFYGPTPQEGRYEHYLVKFRGEGEAEDAANVEQAYADMARSAGLRVPETRLFEGSKSGESYFASCRFDRDGDKRLHAQSASALLYADFRIPSLDYSDLIGITRSVTLDANEASEMFKVATFNVMAHNRDDHSRQFTFLMDREGWWKLAPAYDLTFSLGPGGEHSTSVLGEGRRITRQHLMELGEYADLSAPRTVQIIDRVGTAVAEWNQFAKEAGVGEASRRQIGKTLMSNLGACRGFHKTGRPRA